LVLKKRGLSVIKGKDFYFVGLENKHLTVKNDRKVNLRV